MIACMDRVVNAFKLMDCHRTSHHKKLSLLLVRVAKMVDHILGISIIVHVSHTYCNKDKDVITKKNIKPNMILN